MDQNPVNRRITTGGIDTEHDSSSLLHLTANSGGSLLTSHSSSSGGLNGVSKAQYERLKLDLKLKEADNRFLQEELENKDRMLSMLTEGLKEVGIGLFNDISGQCNEYDYLQVEISQTQWLTTNQELSYELDRALQQNKALKMEMTRLKEQMAQQNASSTGTEIETLQLDYDT
jgi:hypothetical protein